VAELACADGRKTTNFGFRNRGFVESLERFQQNRRIIQDFTTTTLAAIPSEFGRLLYVASLRDLSSGTYEHAGLMVMYPREAVQEALEMCHEELFARILEKPLEEQERDLRFCLSQMKSSSLVRTVQQWVHTQAYRLLVPDGIPEYLRELFCSNLNALLEILGNVETTNPSVSSPRR